MPLKYHAEPQGDPISVPCPASGVELETFIPWTLVKRGVRKEIITPIDTPEAFRDEAEAERQRKRAERHPPLLRALGLAYYWKQLLDEGKFRSFAEIAEVEGISKSHVSRLMQLCRLSPERVQGLMQSPHAARLEKFTRQEVPVCWERQREEMV